MFYSPHRRLDHVSKVLELLLRLHDGNDPRIDGPTNEGIVGSP
jgi:hypothetical protein